MPKRNFVLAVALCLFLLSGCYVPGKMEIQPTHPAQAKGFITEWLVCGPFPTQPDMFYIDYLKDAGGEENITPHEGLEVKRPDGKAVKWRKYTAQENGLVNFVDLYGPKFVKFWKLKNGIAYAFKNIKTEETKRVVFAVGSQDAIQIWLNGKLIHHSRVGRSPKPAQEIVVANLKEGSNRLLVKVARWGGGWGFYLQKFEPEGKLFVNKSPGRDEGHIFVPDLQIGARTDAWGYVPVTNISSNTLKGIGAEIKANELFSPTSSEIRSLAPGETGKLPFKLVTNRKLKPLDRRKEIKVNLSIEADDEVHKLSLKPRLRSPGQNFATSYISEADSSIQFYHVILPRPYDEGTSYGLVITMHGYKGGNISNHYFPKSWAFIAGPNARGEVPYREIGAEDVFEVIEAMKEEYNIDEDRIYLTGHSMGGGGSWYLGLHYPDRFAAIAPMAGGSGEIDFLENALNLPAFVFHGANDPIVNPKHARKMVSTLKDLGYEVRYKQIPEAPHWWGKYCTDDPALFPFFKKHKRDKYPEEVVYKTKDLRQNKAYWVRIDQLEEIGKMARIHARLNKEANRIKVKTDNIAQYTLNLDGNLVDMNSILTVKTNGLPSFRGKPSREIILRRENGKWHPVEKRYPEGLFKRPDSFGPIIDAFNTPFLLVYGTGGTQKERETNRKEAWWTWRWWGSWANGRCKVKSDAEVTPEEIEDYNLILYGNAGSNSIISKINDKLPVRFEDGAVLAGEEQFAGEDVALKMIYPNPLNPDKYVVVNGGVTSKGTENLHKLGSFHRNTKYDYVIFDSTFIGKKKNRYLKAGVFDTKWQLRK